MFGTLTGPEDAGVAAYDDLPLVEPDGPAAQDMPQSLLWEYMNQGTINGVHVAQSDRNLKISSSDMVQNAFQLERVPRSLLVYMSPDDEDGQRRYDEVLSKAYAGEVMIVDEQKQFDPAKGRFVVWLRYDEVHYALHPRFSYLREE